MGKSQTPRWLAEEQWLGSGEAKHVLVGVPGGWQPYWSSVWACKNHPCGQLIEHQKDVIEEVWREEENCTLHSPSV